MGTRELHLGVLTLGEGPPWTPAQGLGEAAGVRVEVPPPAQHKKVAAPMSSSLCSFLTVSLRL